MPPLTRRAARVLCVDRVGAVLLLAGTDPACPDDPPVWLPPGGGLEPGDVAPAAAACRELFEETGLWLDDAGPVVASRRAAFSFAGLDVEQDEHWFAVRTPRFEPVTTGWSHWEERCLRGASWWRPGEPVEGLVPDDVAPLAAAAHAVLPPQPVRPTVRVLVVDSRDRCLLLAAATGAGERVWFPPGGGLEPGEDPVAAARRELAEELGLRVGDVGPCVWTRRHVLDTVDLRERWHLLRVGALEPDVSGWTDEERRDVTDVRWWTMEEMATTGELLVPRDLASLLPGLLDDDRAGRLPDVPVEVGL